MSEPTESITYTHPRSGKVVTYLRATGNRHQLPPRRGTYSVAKVLTLGEKACKRARVEPTSGNVAEALGVSRQTVLAWRQGRTKGVSEVLATAIAERHGTTLRRLEGV